MTKNRSFATFLIFAILLSGCSSNTSTTPSPTQTSPMAIESQQPLSTQSDPMASTPLGPANYGSEIPKSSGTVDTIHANDFSLGMEWEVGSCGNGENQFDQPHGIAFDLDGNAYVADSGNHRVVKLDAKGGWISSWGKQGDEPGDLQNPTDIAVSLEGAVFVLDSDRGTIVHYSTDGAFVSAIGTDAGLYGPRGLTVDRDGNIWVADTGGKRIVELSPSGAVLRTIAGAGPSFGQPTDVAMDSNGTLWFVEGDTGMVRSLHRDGTAGKAYQIFKSDTTDGPHLDIGPTNEVLIADAEGFRIVYISADENNIRQAVEKGIGAGQFLRPVGISVSRIGAVGVADPVGCKVIRYGVH